MEDSTIFTIFCISLAVFMLTALVVTGVFITGKMNICHDNNGIMTEDSYCVIGDVAWKVVYIDGDFKLVKIASEDKYGN